MRTAVDVAAAAEGDAWVRWCASSRRYREVVRAGGDANEKRDAWAAAAADARAHHAAMEHLLDVRAGVRS